MAGFEVDVSLGQESWWTRCTDCGLTWRFGSEDEAVTAGFAHLDEEHPDEEVEPEGVRVATSVVPWRYGTDVSWTCTIHDLEVARLPLRASDKARAQAARRMADHLDEHHPWQVRPEDRERGVTPRGVR